MILECLTLVYAAYERELPAVGSVNLSVKVSAWKLSLQDIPSADLKRVVMKEIQNRTSEFLPVPADFIRRYKGDDSEPTVANAAAYKPLAPTPNEIAMAGTAYKQLPPAEQKEADERVAWIELGARLRRDASKREPNAPQPRQKPRDERELSRAMFDWLHMATYSVSAEIRIAFGLWLLERYLVEEWTPQLGKEQWQLWATGEGAELLRKAKQP